MTESAERLEQCPQCGKPIEKPVVRKIFDRGWNPATRKQYARQRDIAFCSTECGSNYQMGCEG